MQCGAALAMYLAGYSIVDIILQGRWSSNTFMVYIKRAVLERLSGISLQILENDTLTPLPNRPNITPLNQSPSLHSFGSSSVSAYILAPAFHLHY